MFIASNIHVKPGFFTLIILLAEVKDNNNSTPYYDWLSGHLSEKPVNFVIAS